MRRVCIALMLACVLGSATAPAQRPDPNEKKVDPADLAISPPKYVDRDIMLGPIQCYYAGPEDYRCIAPYVRPVLAVFTKKIIDDESRKTLEGMCDTIRVAMTSQHCRTYLHFRYSKDQVDDDIISGFQQRFVIRPDSVTIKHY